MSLDTDLSINGLNEIKNMEIDPPENRREKHRSDTLIEPSNRYIVTKVCDRLITFPDTLVAEILIVERNSILALPFYDAAIIGVVHHQASVMPLLMLKTLLTGERSLVAESLTVVKLSEAVDQLGEVATKRSLSGIGIVVDRVIGSMAIDEYIDVTSTPSNLGIGNALNHKNTNGNGRGNAKGNFINEMVNGTSTELSNIELSDVFGGEIADGSKNSLKNFNQIVANIGDNEYTPIEIVLLSTPTHIWQPQRWQSRG